MIGTNGVGALDEILGKSVTDGQVWKAVSEAKKAAVGGSADGKQDLMLLM